MSPPSASATDAGTVASTRRHKTSAWPLAMAYAALVVYASLFPFAGWRDQGITYWAWVASPLPKWWTAFDLASNVGGYGPFGFLLALAAMRRAEAAGRVPDKLYAVAVATLAGAGLSAAMETVQNYLPSRVPSNLDFALNTAGAFGGAIVAALLERAGALARWSRFRARWFTPDSRGALSLLVLWPFALLFPAAVPFGLGQVLERVEGALAGWLQDTPFLEWLPMREVELQPLVPGAEAVCVALGALAPILLAFSIVPAWNRRAAIAAFVVAAGVASSALSAAMSWGPTHAWAWLGLPARVGLSGALALAWLLVPLPRRGCAAVGLIAIVLHLSVLNLAPAGAYFEDTLQAWEQGRFIRFNGLAQWLGWVWPYVVLAYLVSTLSRGDRDPRIAR